MLGHATIKISGEMSLASLSQALVELEKAIGPNVVISFSYNSAVEVEAVLREPIQALGLKERATNCLRRAQVATVGDLIQKTSSELLKITNFGDNSLEEVVSALNRYGLSLTSE